MQLKSLCLASVASIGLVQPVPAADVPAKVSPSVASWNWAGMYIGGQSGLALAASRFANPFGSSIFGDIVRMPGYLSGGQIGYNWQAENMVYGFDADVGLINGNGTNTCLAFSGNFNSANCKVSPHTTGTFTGRVGTTIGSYGRALLYAKGGLAWTNDRVGVTNNNPLADGFATATTNSTRIGATVGGGIEYAMTANWTARFEYDFLSFENRNVTTPPIYGIDLSASQTVHEAKVGVNYKFGNDAAPWDRATAMPVKAPSIVSTLGWEFEGGGRYWYSRGRFQKDLPAGQTNDQNLISRLTYVDSANSGEFFGRVDTPWALGLGRDWSLFVRGMVGDGRIRSGSMNDEDWGLGPAPSAYSNTFSDLSPTSLNYAIGDIGLNLLRGVSYKVGWFVGYNHWNEQIAATTCTQIASARSRICVPPIVNMPIITETDHWNAARVGVSELC